MHKHLYNPQCQSLTQYLTRSVIRHMDILSVYLSVNDNFEPCDWWTPVIGQLTVYPKVNNLFPFQTSTEQVYPRVDKSYSLPKSK